jgi:dTDP-glucose 4,6-dehydratase
MNIGSGVRISNLEIAKTVFKIMKSQNLTKLKDNNFVKMVKDRPGHDKRYALNTNFLKKILIIKLKKTYI